MSEPNSFGNPEFLKDLEFINDQLSTADLRRQSQSLESPAGDELPDLTGSVAGLSLNRELEQACLATGATGAAIALVREEKIVCYATAGSHVPDIGVCLDPRHGLSGSCFQTRQLQNCNDTETDIRVDPDASRRLGVRSIVVLPLMDGEELFGIVEILSSVPNAFGQSDLDTLRTLTERIVESKRKHSVTKAAAPQKESSPVTKKVEEVVLPGKSRGLDSDPALPRRARASRRSELQGIALGTLVIASAILLGILVGWRLGWQKATLGFRSGSMSYSVNAKDRRTNHTIFPGEKRQPSLAGIDECAPPKVVVPTVQPQGGGLTVSQDGRVIFHLSPSAPSPTRGSQTAPHPPGLKESPSGGGGALELGKN